MANTPIPNRYQLDLSGVSSNNLVADEPHVLISKTVRSIAPTYGPYFTESVEVWDNKTSTKLTKGLDYRCLDIVGLPTAQSGKEICTVIAITSTAVSQDVRISYQALGGGYERNYESIRLLIDALANDTRQVEWNNIVDRPVEFTPTMHLHKLGDLIGFEYLVSVIERLQTAVLMGDELSHGSMLSYMEDSLASLRKLLDDNNVKNTALAIARSAKADTSAKAAYLAVRDSSHQINLVEDLARQSLTNSQLLLVNIPSSENSARNLLNNYQIVAVSQVNSSIRDKPPVAAGGALQFPKDQALGLITKDSYGIDKTGRVIIGTDSEVLPTSSSDLVFSVKLLTFKEVGTGEARIDIQINAHDQRSLVLDGAFSQNCIVEIFPIQFQDGKGGLTPTYASEATYTYSEAPVDGVLRGISYGIIGVDPAAVLDMKLGTSGIAAIARRIADSLLDCRCDYNIKNYGNAPKRSGIVLSMSQGSEVTLSFKLSGVELADIRKGIQLSFRQYLRVMRSNTSAQVTLIKDGPDAGKIRSLSVSF